MKFKKNIEVTTSDFWYDLFDGGYIRPRVILEDEDEAQAIEEARFLLKKFRDELERQGLINHL